MSHDSDMLKSYETAPNPPVDPTPVNMPTSGDAQAPALSSSSPYTPVSSTTAVKLPFEVVKALPQFARDGLSFFKTVGSLSRIWGNLITNWVRFEHACKTKGVSQLLPNLINLT